MKIDHLAFFLFLLSQCKNSFHHHHHHHRLTFVFSLFQAAYQAADDEVGLTTMGRTYSIDFNTMTQINEDTGNSRSVQRKANPLAAPASGE